MLRRKLKNMESTWSTMLQAAETIALPRVSYTGMWVLGSVGLRQAGQPANRSIDQPEPHIPLLPLHPQAHPPAARRGCTPGRCGG